MSCETVTLAIPRPSPAAINSHSAPADTQKQTEIGP